MYKHTLAVSNQYLAKEQELPKNTSVEGNQEALYLGGDMGGLIELVMVVEEQCTLPASSSITLELLECDTLDGNYEKAPVKSSIQSTEEKVWEKGDIILRLPLSSYTKAYIKAVIATTSANIKGSISLIPSYLAR